MQKQQNKRVSLPELASFNKKHELNNEGCRCPLCQKVNMRDNLALSILCFTDRLSEQYNPIHHKQLYLQLINQLSSWQKYNRKLRFCLPELCVFFQGSPLHLITKNKQNATIKMIRSKSKLNVFELQSFFLEGYLLHHPEITNKKRQKEQFKERTRQITIAAAKYNKNVTILFTLQQIGNMFKSKYKYMKEGLIYLQTLVGAHHSTQFSIIIDLVMLKTEHETLYDRARTQASIFVGQIKVTDSEFYPEKAQIQYERQLRQSNHRLYLIYLSLKMVFISGKLHPNIMKESVFKWTCVRGNDFLWDVRAQTYDKSTAYWQSSGMQALEIKLKKTMSMMQLEPEHLKMQPIGLRAREMSRWLQKSTEDQWKEMSIIRSRLEKLEIQKKSLLESQKESLEGGNRTFRLRSLKRRQSMNQSSILQ